MGDHDAYVDDPPSVLLKLERLLHAALPPVVALLFGYLYVVFFTDVSHPIVGYVEKGILAYFVAEIGVAALLYEDKRRFLREKWFNILLVLPFLAAVRTASQTARLVGALRALEGFQSIALAELPVVGRVVAGAQGWIGLNQFPYLRKMGHGIYDLPKALKKLPVSVVWSDLRRVPIDRVLAVLSGGVVGAIVAAVGRDSDRPDADSAGEDGSSEGSASTGRNVSTGKNGSTDESLDGGGTGETG